MAWGLWKKFKKGIRKAGIWLKDKLSRAATIVKKIKPELAKIDSSQGWGGKLTKISDDIVNINDKVQKGDVAGAITYAGKQWTPKFKLTSSV